MEAERIYERKVLSGPRSGLLLKGHAPGTELFSAVLHLNEPLLHKGFGNSFICVGEEKNGIKNKTART